MELDLQYSSLDFVSSWAGRGGLGKAGMRRKAPVREIVHAMKGPGAGRQPIINRLNLEKPLSQYHNKQEEINGERWFHASRNIREPYSGGVTKVVNSDTWFMPM